MVSLQGGATRYLRTGSVHIPSHTNLPHRCENVVGGEQRPFNFLMQRSGIDGLIMALHIGVKEH
jgi:hypothetical protein